MARPLKPFIRGGGYYPSRRWTPLVYPGGYTTANGGEEPAPPPIEKTITGNPIHILDALARPAQALSVKLDPVQDLHGYDSPWPAGGGKNKFNPAEAQNNKWINSTTGEIESVSGFWITGFIPVKSGDVIRSARKGSARNAWYNADKSQATYFAFNGDGSATAPSDGFVVLAASSSTVAYGSDFIVTINDADLTFSPYSNICPISGRTSATVTRTGKNLLNLSSLRGGEFDRVRTLPAYNISTNDYLPIKGGQEYVWSQKRYPTGGGRYVRWYDIDKLQIGSVNIYSDSSYPLTAPDNACFARFMWYLPTQYQSIDDIIADEPMIQYGSTATAYEPYQGNTYTIQLGQTVYGGTLDVTGGKMVVDRANIASYNGEPLPGEWISDRDVYSTGGTPTIGAQVVYFLATPIEITLTPTQIDMLLGENNLWADAGDLTLTYYADGNASTSEALGILLGGTYNNPGGADDVSDDEALEILLGGS